MKLLKPIHALPAEADTQGLAAALAHEAKPGDIICLYGPLGSGKSVFARAFVRALTGAHTEVPSPTFTLVQHYDAPGFEIVHADLYRLEHDEEIIEIGLEEGFDDAVTLIEWPQRLGRFLPASRLDLELTIEADKARTATLTAHGKHWSDRMEFNS